MSNKMRVYAFSVEYFKGAPPLADVLPELRKKVNGNLTSANIDKTDYTLRAEKVINTRRTAQWKILFCRLRYTNGPGQASRAKTTKPIPFTGDETFSETTACLYDGDTDHLLLQSNLHGATCHQVGRYLTEMMRGFVREGSVSIASNVNIDGPDHPYYELAPKLDPKTWEKFQNATATKSFTIGIAAAHLKELPLGGEITLADSLQKTELGQNVRIELTVKAPEKRHDSIDQGFMGRIKRQFKKISDKSDKLEAKVRTSTDQKLQLLDLVHQRLVKEYKYKKPVTDDRMLPENWRFECLKDALDQWRPLLKSDLPNGA